MIRLICLSSTIKLLKDILYRSEKDTKILKRKDLEPLFFLYQRMANDIDEKTANSVPYAQTCIWEWYTSLLSDPKLSLNLLPSLDLYLLTTMKIVVQTKNRVIFKSFIAATIDKFWFHNFDLYSKTKNSASLIMKIQEELPGTILQEISGKDE
mgnify:FL=1